MSLTATDIFHELTVLARGSVSARTRLRQFLDQDPVVATLEVDTDATTRAGETIPWDQPTEGLLACLAACRAAYRDDNAAAAVSAHGSVPPVLGGDI